MGSHHSHPAWGGSVGLSGSWVIKRGDKCARSKYRGRSALAIARAFSRWRSGVRLANMINCTTSLPPGSGIAAPVETELLVQADKLVGGSDAVLVIDDTAIPKKGAHSHHLFYSFYFLT